MKNKILLLVLVLSLSVLTACGGDEKLSYVGESENWKVKYTVNNKGNEEVERAIDLEYLGSNISDVEEFQFAVKTEIGKWGQGIIELDENGFYASSGTTKFKGNLNIKDKPVFTINWNNNEEEIILESK